MLQNILNSAPEDVQSRVASAFIKHPKQVTIRLKTGGTPIHVSVVPEAQEPTPNKSGFQITHNDMERIQSRSHLTQKQVLNVADDLRSDFDDIILTPYLRNPPKKFQRDANFLR